MNILVLCHYGLLQNLENSFVFNQFREYSMMGHHVKVIIPIAWGKRNQRGNRFGKLAECQKYENIELIYLRYLSLSSYGEKAFNISSAVRSLKLTIRKTLDGFQPDLIHAHTLGFDSEVGSFLKIYFHCPLVVTSHGSDASVPISAGNYESVRRWCSSADAVVAVSSHLAENIRASGTTTPVYTILNGFSVRFLSQNYKKENLYLLQASHLISQKKNDVTIHAFARICRSNPQARLGIIGQGSEEEKLKRLCKELNLQDKTHFMGEIPNREVLEQMGAAQFFVMPSVREGFGIVYLEAMASGCITIGTEKEGISDLIENGKNGFLVPPDDPEAIAQCITWCLEHPEKAEQIALRGKKDALELTWEKNAQQYLQLFEKLRKEQGSLPISQRSR